MNSPNRTEEQRLSAVVEASGAVIALELWTQWMHSASDLRAMWYPAKSCGLRGGGVVTNDAFHDLEEECNSVTIQTVEAAVNCLPPAMRAAVERYCGLCFCVTIRDYESQLAEACSRIRRALVANGCEVGYAV